MSELQEIKQYLSKIPIEELNNHKKYFKKFLPIFYELKEECCEKYCLRPSGRYCNSCPVHPIRVTDNKLFDLQKVQNFLQNNMYIEFVEYLFKRNFPYPNMVELRERFTK